VKSGTKIVHFRWLTATFLVIGALAGCATTDPRPPEGKGAVETRAVSYQRSGYACCNLRYTGDLITDASLAQWPFIAIGTPIRVKGIDGHHAAVEVDGKPMRLVLDQGRKGESVEQWVNQLVVLEDPSSQLQGFAPAVRNAIVRGQVMKGMTTEQVIMALGYPQLDSKLHLDGPSWRYWWSTMAPYYVYWTKKRTVARIDGHAEAVANMVYKGK